MATNKNKSGSSGMRILWIPGKKKQPKGSYNPTNKGNTSPYYQHKKTEPWSLGGVKGQEELLKAEIPGSEMASTSIVNCLPQTIGIGAACGDPAKPEAGAEGGASENGHSNGLLPKGDLESSSSSNGSISPQPMSPRLGPLANIDEDEHENDFDDHKDYNGTINNTATLLLKDRRMRKKILSEKNEKSDLDDDDEDEKKKDPEKTKLDMADGVPHMRGMNRKQTLERRYRDQGKEIDREQEEKDNKKKKEKSGVNEKAVDCLYFGLMCCECSIQ